VKRSGSKRVANRLVALGSAAVLTVYAAGFLRTRAAAQKLAGADQRRVAPAPAEAGGSSAPPFIEPPALAGKTESPQAARPAKRDVAAAATSPAPKRAAKVSATAAPRATPAPAQATPAATLPNAAMTTATVPPTIPPVAGSDSRTVEPTPPPAPKPLSLYKDGTYSGWGTSRHGDIQAAVVIEDGRIVSAYIAQCLTRYSCSWIAHLPPQVVSRQSPECDYVSGATQSTNAFYYAIVEALSKAK
jgi:uncharacterized protein with FMN-binding domain